MASILRVNPTDVAALWGQVEPLVTLALRNADTHDSEDVRGALLCGTATLFVQYSDMVEAIAITQFITYPKGIWLNVWLVAAGTGSELDDDEFFQTIDHYRQINGCRGFQYTGARQGWAKRFPGFKPEGINMRKTIH